MRLIENHKTEERFIIRWQKNRIACRCGGVAIQEFLCLSCILIGALNSPRARSPHGLLEQSPPPVGRVVELGQIGLLLELKQLEK